MKALKKLLFTLLIIFSVKANYSIQSFIDYVKNKGFYDIIFQVKISLGKDVAIEVCFSMVENSQCDELVRVYMNEGGSGNSGSNGTFPNPSDVDIIIYPEVGLDSNKTSVILERKLELKLQQTKTSSDFKEKIKNIFKECDYKSKIIVIIFIENYGALSLKMSEDDIIKILKKSIYKRQKPVISEY